MKTFLTNFTIILTIFFCTSCNKPRQSPTKGMTVLDSLQLNLGMPTSMTICKDYIFIVDFFSGNKNIVNVYDKASKTFLFSFGTKGKGPHEYLHIDGIDIYETPDGIKASIYDSSSFKVGIYDLDGLIKDKEKCIPIIITQKMKDVSYLEIGKVNGGYLATGLTEEYKYTLLSDSLTPVAHFGSYRPKPIKSIPDIQHAIANYGKTVISKDGKSFIEIVYNASVLSLYEQSGNTFEKKWENIIKELYYKLRGEAIEETTCGYLSACFGDRYIYALYSGERENPKANATYAKEIHVYDKNSGQIIGKYTLSTPAFLCETDGEKLYVLSHEPEPKITIYKLP